MSMLAYLDEIIETSKDAKKQQMAVRSVLVQKPQFLGYVISTYFN
jgi:hypothetical protein